MILSLGNSFSFFLRRTSHALDFKTKTLLSKQYSKVQLQNSVSKKIFGIVASFDNANPEKRGKNGERKGKKKLGTFDKSRWRLSLADLCKEDGSCMI